MLLQSGPRPCGPPQGLSRGVGSARGHTDALNRKHKASEVASGQGQAQACCLSSVPGCLGGGVPSLPTTSPEASYLVRKGGWGPGSDGIWERISSYKEES